MSNIFLTPKVIINGNDALLNAKEQICTLGNKALIVTDLNMIKFGAIEKLTCILKECNIDFFIFSEANNEPDDILVTNGSKVFKDNDCDFLIALGGGSPIDTMKGISILLSSSEELSSHLGKEIILKRPKMVAIPTTAGTGSEATQFTIIKDTKTKVKMLLKGSDLIPDLAIVDPNFTFSLPKSVTAATGIDALCHSLESFTSKKAQPLSNTFALSSIKRILNNLETCYKEPQNIKAREEMCLASLEAGISFNNSSVTIIHGMSRPLGSIFNIPHGLSNAMLLETCLTYIREDIVSDLSIISKYCNIAPTEASPFEASILLLNKISSLLRNLDIPSLKKFGVVKEEYLGYIDKMAKDAINSGSPSNTKKELDEIQLVQLYKSLI